MARPITKEEVINLAKENYCKLNKSIAELTVRELARDFDFTEDSKKKEAHWKRDKNLRDVLIHLYEWHRLLLQWVVANRKGEKTSFLPQPYNWKTYGGLNVEFWEKHQDTELSQAKEWLDHSHEEVLALLESFTQEELFTKGVPDWVGGTTLGSYFISVTSSHYDWAIKKIKAHKKNCQSK